MLRYRLLIFSRWCQVMLRFEKGMYENPDQDLNKLWWDLVEKYQLVKRPAGPQRARLRQQDPHRQRTGLLPQLHDGRAVRLAVAPRHRPRRVPAAPTRTRVIYADNKAVGDFMKKKVFEPGRTLTWNELTKFATGATLNAQAFAADFKAK